MRQLRSLLLASAISAVCVATALAGPADPPAAEPDALEMSIEDNLETPAVPKKATTYVRTAMDQLRRSMLKKGYTATLLRNGEVLEITIPCSELFASCATELKPAGIKRLEGLGSLAADNDKYKLLIAAHSDNTGDEMYADSITAARANAIDDLLWQLSGRSDTNTVPYGLGSDEPLKPNTSRAGREANRRVEIYVVPDWGLLQAAGVKRK